MLAPLFPFFPVLVTFRGLQLPANEKENNQVIYDTREGNAWGMTMISPKVVMNWPINNKV